MTEQEQTDPVARWAAQAKRIDWFTRPEVRADGSDVRLLGGTVNLCFNALDRHVIRGRADELALVTDRRTYSYAQLLEQVAQLGGGLRELGVQVGDRVLVALPTATSGSSRCWPAPGSERPIPSCGGRVGIEPGGGVRTPRGPRS